MRRPLALILILTAVGCSGPASPPAPVAAAPSPPADPANDRLMPGQTVMVVSKLEGDMIPISPPGGGEFPTGSAERRVAFVRTSDMGQVITDEDPASGPARPVKIKITKSDLSAPDCTIVGSTCTVPREVLRAAIKE